MKITRAEKDKNLPIYISLILSLITFLAVWQIGALAVPVVFILFQVLFILWIASLFPLQFLPQLRKYVSFNAIVNAFLIYLGALFISFSRFKDSLSNVPLDLNMIGIGLALVGIASGFIAQRQEQKSENNNLDPTPPRITHDENIPVATQELPSIDVVLDETRRTLDFQFEQLDGLDTKSGIILGIAGVVITLMVTALIQRPDLFNVLWLKVLLALVVIVLFVSLLLSYRNISIMKWSKPPEIMTLRTDYITDDSQKTKLKSNKSSGTVPNCPPGIQ